MNNYHYYEEIHKSSSSTIYKGRIKKSLEYIAIKSFDKKRESQILNEIKI